jgi:hypothetical protein
MPFALGSVAPMLAYKAGTLVIVAVILGVVLAIYSIYYLIFRIGKDKP